MTILQLTALCFIFPRKTACNQFTSKEFPPKRRRTCHLRADYQPTDPAGTSPAPPARLASVRSEPLPAEGCCQLSLLTPVSSGTSTHLQVDGYAPQTRTTMDNLSLLGHFPAPNTPPFRIWTPSEVACFVEFAFECLTPRQGSDVTRQSWEWDVHRATAFNLPIAVPGSGIRESLIENKGSPTSLFSCYHPLPGESFACLV